MSKDINKDCRLYMYSVTILWYVTGLFVM